MRAPCNLAVQANRGRGQLQAGASAAVWWIGWRPPAAWHMWGGWGVLLQCLLELHRSHSKLAVAGGRASNAVHAYMPAATCQAKRTTSTATAMKHCRAGCRHDGGLHQHGLGGDHWQRLLQCLVLHGGSPPDPHLPSAPSPPGPPAGRGSPAAAAGCPAPAYRKSLVAVTVIFSWNVRQS